MTEKRKDPVERKKYNTTQLEMYITKQGNLASVILKYQSEISHGPTCVCSCCGFLHFRKYVVVLKRETDCLTSQSKSDFVDQICVYHSIDTEFICVINVTCTSKKVEFPR